jgi:hypothetical protein
MARFELTARQYNAVKITLDGIEASYRRRLPELIAEDRQRLASIRRRLKRRGLRPTARSIRSVPVGFRHVNPSPALFGRRRRHQK